MFERAQRVECSCRIMRGTFMINSSDERSGQALCGARSRAAEPRNSRLRDVVAALVSRSAECAAAAERCQRLADGRSGNDRCEEFPPPHTMLLQVRKRTHFEPALCGSYVILRRGRRAWQ